MILKYSPIIYFHPNEKYFPVSIDWLMKYSKLAVLNTSTNQMDIISAPITNNAVYNLYISSNKQLKTDGEILWSFGSELHKGEQPTFSVPCYTLFRYSQNNKMYITYIFLYGYNGEYPILNLVNAGFHPADIEHITVELSNNGQTLDRVMYGAHGTTDGRWIKAKDVQTEDGKIVAFAALNGHGLYPEDGFAFRIGGLANDYLGKGLKWEPSPIRIYLPDDPNFNPATMGWVAFNGRFGGELKVNNKEGIAPLLDKNWIRDIDNTDESILKPPKIFKSKFEKQIIAIKNILILMLIYFIFFYTLMKIDKRGKQPGKFNFNEHILTITYILILYLLLRGVAKKLILKYAPS